MANKYRGEVDLPTLGKGVFLAYDLDDFAVIEEEFGTQFFNAIETKVFEASLPAIRKMLAIGLRQRKNGEVETIGEAFDFHALHQRGYNFGDAAKPIMNALSMSWIGKTHDELIDEALKERAKQDAESVARAKEAAEKAGVPFDEGFLRGLSTLLTGQGFAPPSSGD